ncbi:hypothetical protein ABID56_001764 [Alkalibacillus flavidus]|uniref:Uncharacterized protein n=1 Tax=Alkalibacillus flavidus TaxID=546021 RepID=A0ABV2KY81_9BACI
MSQNTNAEQLFKKESERLPNVIYATDDRRREVYGLASEFERVMQTYKGEDLTLDDVIFAQKTTNAWLDPTVMSRPAIVSAPPGYGKSTLLEIFLWHKVRNDPNFGAIVVKERLDEIKRLAEQINNDGGDGLLQPRNKYAYYIEGFDEDRLSREIYDAQFTVQSEYNVVLMTTKQFELQTLKDSTHEFSFFKDDTGAKHPRRLLCIDEKPAMTISHRITSREINAMIDDIRAVNGKANAKVKRQYKRIREAIIKLRDHFESADIENVEELEAVNTSFKIPREFLSQFLAMFDYNKLSQLRALENIITRGGLMSLVNGTTIIQTTHKLHFDWTQYNTFILDGTGRVDPEYDPAEFYLVEPEHTPNYSNVTFHINNDHTLSKASLYGDFEAVPKIAAEVRKIAEEHDGKTLVVTYKNYIDAFQGELNDLLEADELQLKHFDSGRGSNAFRDINNAIYIGQLNKGGLTYPSQAQATVGDREGLKLDPTYNVGKNGLRYNDPVVEQYKQLDMAVNLVQETNRLRANTKAEPVHFYIFTKNEDTVKHLTESYPGCEIETFNTSQKLTGKKTAEDNIRAYFEKMKPGDSVKQSEIYKELDIDRTTFHKAIQKESMQKFIENQKISKVKTRFIKGGGE